jgi:hypothetical protein
MWAETSLLLVGFGQQASCQLSAFSSCPRVLFLCLLTQVQLVK